MKKRTMNGMIARGVAGIAMTMNILIGCVFAADSEQYYTEPEYYESRPDPKRESHFGEVGVTGLKLRTFPGVVIKVEKTIPGSPAEGKFAIGDIVTGVNGVAHKGKNAFLVMGNAVTKAEAEDGKLVFDVTPADGTANKQVTVNIPVLGAYSSTWPLKCEKSKAIIASAAKHYSQTNFGGLECGLACIFLLSTGDDQYLPVVKDFIEKHLLNPSGCTWTNGYAGIAIGEYYLRTGDRSVLPAMQKYCDWAKDAQGYGIGWGHYNAPMMVGYVTGGLMNAAGGPMAVTLLLGEECGVKIDEKVLLGAVRHLYRFAGLGSIAYGDHRPEAYWLGSANGKDGMAAAMLQLASGAEGDSTSFLNARNYFAFATVIADAVVVRGHGDEGRSDALWRGIASSYVLDFNPAEYHACMNRLRWFYDLSRRASGGFGVATSTAFDDNASGIGPALAYTAPLKTLRITGAPRTKYSKEFKLPRNIWGTMADREFHSVENAKAYNNYGPGESAYHSLIKMTHAVKNDPNACSREDMLRNVFHWHTGVRTNAARLMMYKGEFTLLEKLLESKDARLRRAGLDGLADYDFWNGMGNKPISSENVSPAMLKSIRRMLANPDESLFVLDGALMALSRAPSAEIAKSMPLILPLVSSEEWWVRDSAVRALVVALPEGSVREKALAVLGERMLVEDRPWVRATMHHLLTQQANTVKPDSKLGRQIIALINKGTEKTVLPENTDKGGWDYYVKDLVLRSLQLNPEDALAVASLFRKHFPKVKTVYIAEVVNALLPLRDKVPTAERNALTDLLYGAYRHELIKRSQTDKSQLDLLISMGQLKRANLGWKEMGSPGPAERVWDYITVNPKEQKDMIPVYEGRRYREITLPAGLENWYKPEFDARNWTGGKWLSGKAPVGIGTQGGDQKFKDVSPWGDGEFLLMRTTFELDSLDYDYVRIRMLAMQGYQVFINGHHIHTYVWWDKLSDYGQVMLNPDQMKHLKKGPNVLAFYTVAAVENRNNEYVRFGQADLRIEGLRVAEVYSLDSK